MEIKPSPNLWLAIFDPTSGLEQALDSGYSPLNPMNANGMSSINLNLNLRQSLNGTQLYYYSVLMTIPYRIEKLIRRYRSVCLYGTVSELSLRPQHKRHGAMYYNFVYTVHELHPNDHDPKASHDLDSKYYIARLDHLLRISADLGYLIDRMRLLQLVLILPLCNS